MATHSPSSLWVICSRGRYLPFLADFDSIYTDKGEAEIEAQKMNNDVELHKFGVDIKYYVRSLGDAIYDARDDARAEGQNEGRSEGY